MVPLSDPVERVARVTRRSCFSLYLNHTDLAVGNVQGQVVCRLSNRLGLQLPFVVFHPLRFPASGPSLARHLARFVAPCGQHSTVWRFEHIAHQETALLCVICVGPNCSSWYPCSQHYIQGVISPSSRVLERSSLDYQVSSVLESTLDSSCRIHPEDTEISLRFPICFSILSRGSFFPIEHRTQAQ